MLDLITLQLLCSVQFSRANVTVAADTMTLDDPDPRSLDQPQPVSEATPAAVNLDTRHKHIYY